MGWTNPIDPVKPTQSKKVGRGGLFGGFRFQNKKFIKKIGFRAKPNPNSKNPLNR
jgi:hypothetical protein